MTFLCKIEGMADPGTRNVVLGEGPDELDIVIVQTAGTRHAYINSCPHEHIPLETFPNHFLTEDKKYLLCSGHGARFVLATGECVSGPCFGQIADAASDRGTRRRALSRRSAPARQRSRARCASAAAGTTWTENKLPPAHKVARRTA